MSSAAMLRTTEQKSCLEFRVQQPLKLLAAGPKIKNPNQVIIAMIGQAPGSIISLRKSVVLIRSEANGWLLWGIDGSQAHLCKKIAICLAGDPDLLIQLLRSCTACHVCKCRLYIDEGSSLQLPDTSIHKGVEEKLD